MSVTIYREVQGVRFAETNHGDTLQQIALRELGDGSRWPELVALNGLRPPFLVDDLADVAPGVLLTGQLIKVPSASGQVRTTDADLVFERDVQLTDAGDIVADGGDFGLVSGLDNLRQALRNRLETDRGELVFHPAYGSLLRRIIGTVNGPTAALLASSYTKAALLSDSRVRRVTSAKARVSGDVVAVEANLEPIVGRAIQISESV